MIMPLCNRMFCCIFGWYFFIKSGWNMKKLFCCPALELFHCLPPLFRCLPLWKTVRLHGKKLQNATKARIPVLLRLKHQKFLNYKHWLQNYSLDCVNQAHGNKLLFSIQEWVKLELVRKVVFDITQWKFCTLLNCVGLMLQMLEPNHLTAHSTGITKVKRDSLHIVILEYSNIKE